VAAKEAGWLEGYKQQLLLGGTLFVALAVEEVTALPAAPARAAPLGLPLHAASVSAEPSSAPTIFTCVARMTAQRAEVTEGHVAAAAVRSCRRTRLW